MTDATISSLHNSTTKCPKDTVPSAFQNAPAPRSLVSRTPFHRGSRAIGMLLLPPLPFTFRRNATLQFASARPLQGIL